MKKPRLICIGDLMLDVVVRASADVAAATDTPGSVRFRLGGSAGNTCRAFVGLGGRAALVCAAGTDGLARSLSTALHDSGVAVHARRVEGTTPRLLAMIASNGERTFITDRGVADSLAPESLKKSWFARADALHLPAYSLLTPPLSLASLEGVRLARAAGALVSVDLASTGPLLSAGRADVIKTLKAVAPDILFANLDEVGAVAGRRGARSLLELAGLVVVKLGSSGCQLVWHNPVRDSVLQVEVATRPLPIGTDTTGAGDAFDAGFLHQLLISGLDTSRPSAQLLLRAALVGHRRAARLLASSRPEIAL